MNSLQQAMTVLHEVIYKEMIARGQQDSRHTRYMNSLIASNEIQTVMNPCDWLNISWKDLPQNQKKFIINDQEVSILSNDMPSCINATKTFHYGHSRNKLPIAVQNLGYVKTAKINLFIEIISHWDTQKTEFYLRQQAIDLSNNTKAFRDKLYRYVLQSRWNDSATSKLPQPVPALNLMINSTISQSDTLPLHFYVEQERYMSSIALWTISTVFLTPIVSYIMASAFDSTREGHNYSAININKKHLPLRETYATYLKSKEKFIQTQLTGFDLNRFLINESLPSLALDFDWQNQKLKFEE